MNAHDTSLVRVACALHRSLCCLLPGRFRARFGQELAQTFAAACRSAHALGAAAMLRFTLRALLDVVVSSSRLHMDAMRKRLRSGLPSLLVLLAVALCCATAIGWLDLHADEVQGSVLCILACTCLLALLRPRAALLWWLVVGMSVPAAWVLASLLGSKPAVAPDPPASVLLALIPAAVGAGAGWLVRHVLRPQRSGAP